MPAKFFLDLSTSLFLLPVQLQALSDSFPPIPHLHSFALKLP